MYGQATIKADVVALTLLVHWAGHDILDLSSGLVHILLPIGFVLHLSLLLGTSLLFMLVVTICGSVVWHRLVFSFCDEGLIYQRLKIWKVKHAESTP